MCFNASASFVTSATMTVIGAASMSESKNRKQRIMSLIPFGFAIQQAFEGYQWLSLGSGVACTKAAYGFLFFAFLVWPIFVPAIVLMNEKRPKKILKWLLATGIVSALLNLYGLLIYPLKIVVEQHSIVYLIDMHYYSASAVLYLSAVCGSLLLSSKKLIRYFGLIASLSAIISLYFYYDAFISVWCFFAAVISGLIYIYIKQENNH